MSGRLGPYMTVPSVVCDCTLSGPEFVRNARAWLPGQTYGAEAGGSADCAGDSQTPAFLGTTSLASQL